MRMRKKKWARPELEACEYYVMEPERLRGHWRERFGNDKPMHLELGCGKGVSTAQMMAANRDVNYIAIDLSSNVLAVTRRNIAAAFDGDEVKNALLVVWNIAIIDRIFSGDDKMDRIIISFCNPWSEKVRHEKRRLTYTRQLMMYREFLKDGGEIWFKTDDDPLFHDSLQYFKDAGFSLCYVTYDLHESGFQPNYVSEHEQKFTDMGIPTKFLIAVKEPMETAEQV